MNKYARMHKGFQFQCDAKKMKIMTKNQRQIMENFHYFITYYNKLPTSNILMNNGQETRGVSSLYMRTSGGRSTVKNTNENREIGPKLDWK